MKKHLVIPARFNSTRLHGKPLKMIHHKPMIHWVIDRAQAVDFVDTCQVATDSVAIYQSCIDYGATAMMTSETHQSGTDRLAEVAIHNGWDDQDIVINMQGDEPLVPATLIEQVTQLLMAHPECVMATLAEPILTMEEAERPSIVKVVTDNQRHALYFSRAPIPYKRQDASTPDALANSPKALRHLGLYAYRVGLLKQFVNWESGYLEQLESLEQLRILENGGKIAIDIAKTTLPPGVDTQADLDRLNAMSIEAFSHYFDAP